MSGAYYFVDNVADMVNLSPYCDYGDEVNLRGEVYKFNGKNWTKQIGDAVKQGKKQRIEYFGEPPFYINGTRFAYHIDTALTAAWESDIVRYVWLSGKYFDGKAEVGDILNVRDRRWRICAKDDRLNKYLVEKCFNYT